LQKSFPAPEVAAAVGAEVREWEAVESSGYARNATHWRVTLADGTRAFAKVALDDDYAGWLRTEYKVYSNVKGDFLPMLLGWHDGGVTLIVLEDLTESEWPPPWSAPRVAAVCRSLEDVHRAPPPPGLPRVADAREELNGWEAVAEEPGPLLSTGLCAPEWLDAHLPVLLDAGRTCELDGEELLHFDVRSDNLCLRDGRAVLFDWNWASVGNGLIDLVGWAPSLRLEDGPEPWELVPDSRGLSALIAGFFCARAGLPPPPTAPTVREFVRRQAAVALPWAARELGLPPTLAS
jgi:aminoglycoside phosphotransferase (APT) family kinase protein